MRAILSGIVSGRDDESTPSPILKAAEKCTVNYIKYIHRHVRF